VVETSYWNKYNKIPFNRDNLVENAVYMILFYERKRALLLRKNLTVICTMETRKAKQLIEEAKEKKWITQVSGAIKMVKYENYPKACDEAFWIEVMGI
jgi:CRISPR/Cas system-associated protein Csx1